MSALRRAGVDDLLESVGKSLGSFSVRVQLRVPYSEASLLSQLHDGGCIHSKSFEADVVVLDVEMPRSKVRDLRRFCRTP